MKDHCNQLSWPYMFRTRFLSLAQSKLRLCSANHRSGYWSNLPCDCLSTVCAYSEQETEKSPCLVRSNSVLVGLHGRKLARYVFDHMCSWLVPLTPITGKYKVSTFPRVSASTIYLWYFGANNDFVVVFIFSLLLDCIISIRNLRQKRHSCDVNAKSIWEPW